MDNKSVCDTRENIGLALIPKFSSRVCEAFDLNVNNSQRFIC